MTAQRPLWLGSSDRFARLRRIESLDPKKDYLEISSHFFGDFRSIMLSVPLGGFLTTFASPRMSRILSGTGELEHRFAKRAVDTSLFANLVHTHGFGTTLGRTAARKVNDLHSHYDIAQEDFVLVGCDPPVYAVDMAERFGWRPVTDKEREAMRHFFSNQARAFGSRRSLPETMDQMRSLVSAYFDEHLWFEPQNRRMAITAINWYSDLAPPLMRPLMRRLFPALIDPRVLKACGLPAPSALSRLGATMMMKRLGRRDPVADGAPNELEELAKKIYPDGWNLTMLGPQPKAPAEPRQESQTA